MNTEEEFDFEHGMVILKMESDSDRDEGQESALLENVEQRQTLEDERRQLEQDKQDLKTEKLEFQRQKAEFEKEMADQRRDLESQKQRVEIGKRSLGEKVLEIGQGKSELDAGNLKLKEEQKELAKKQKKFESRRQAFKKERSEFKKQQRNSNQLGKAKKTATLALVESEISSVPTSSKNKRFNQFLGVFTKQIRQEIALSSGVPPKKQRTSRKK